jgi:hypothetical protein
MEKESGEVAEVPNLIAMRVTTLMIGNAVSACLFGQAVITTKGSTRTTSEKAMERCIGLMEVAIKESGLAAFNTDMGE